MTLVSKSFSEIVTFSRSSNATRVGPTGVLEYAPHNLLLQSQTFDNASWLLLDSSISANSAAAPDGTVTADKLVENTANSNHTVYQAGITTVTATVSVYAKAAGRSNLIIRQYQADTEVVSANFDLSAGTVSKTLNQGTTFTSPLYSITPVGNGWYRCTVTATRSSGTTVVAFDLSNTSNPTFRSGGDVSYTGDGTSGIYLWGAQLSVGPYALDYTPTTSAAVYGPRFDYDGSGVTIVEPVSTNLLLYSQEFNNAAWSTSVTAVTANNAIAPDGTLTADTATIQNTGYLVQTYTAPSSLPYVLSVWMRAASSTTVKLGFQSPSDVTSCNVTTTWQRFTHTNVRNGLFYPQIYNDSGSAVTVELWGAQLEVGSTATAYMVSGATNGFRAVPVVSGSATPKGLLVEEQRTNLALYSEDLTNAAWSKDQGTIASNATTSPDGTVTADKFVESAATAERRVYQLIAVGANAVAFSIFAKAAGRNRVLLRESSFSGAYATFDLSSGTVVESGAGGTGTITNLGNGWYRCVMVHTSATARSNNYSIYPLLNSGLNYGDAVYTGDGTSGLYLWGAQLEANASFASSYIPTPTNSAVTRSADVANVNTLSPWFNATEGTVYTEFDIIGKTSTFGMASQVDDGTLNNRILNIAQEASGGDVKTGSFIAASSASQMNEYPVTSMTVGSVYKNVLAFKTNDCANVVNGVSIVDGVVTLPTGLTTTRLGNRISDGYLNGHLRRFAFYPRRLTASELTALTA